ncbi:hypothetical protein Ahy_A10g048888 [Arachis hypogaea]|uniref:Uncharacterized protein n=1 Tax=Arachis hypogaea TaxID=3818 RepID=A0A445B6A1_ARAHY|nr:hypothetical protein Ahy_A10g048888 [Arachis hypogaea]
MVSADRQVQQSGARTVATASRDFEECRALSWGSAVLAWTYQSLCLEAQQRVTDIAGWLDCSSRVETNTSPGSCSIGYPSTGYGSMRVYDDPAMQGLCPDWFCEEVKWSTWLSAVPIVCFNIFWFHHVDRVKQQFNGKQPVPGTPVNLDRYLTTTDRGEDVWWPKRLQ